MYTTRKSDISRINGLDLNALGNIVEQVADNPAEAFAGFKISSRWQGRTLSEHKVDSYTLGGKTIARDVTVLADQPNQILGNDSAPNPQELLMTALNACMMVGYVTAASIRGISLELLEIETNGKLDLRGFLGISPETTPGYEQISYKVRIKGNGSEAEFREIHDAVIRTSPNYFNIARPVEMNADLEIMN